MTNAQRSWLREQAGRWIGGVTLVLAIALFYSTFRWMAYEFALPRNDLSHGWIVPLFSAYVIWSRRAELRRAAGRPDGRGLVAVIAGLALFWLGSRGGQMRLCQVAFIWEVWAVPFALYGAGVARLMVFPAAYLCFFIPMGFLDFFTVRLRLGTAAFAASVLNGVGIPVLREGTGLQSLAGEGFSLDIADPCSGLRSLFAMTALTAGYAFMTLRGRLRQWALFLCAVPLAVIGNAVRIFSITLVARFMGTAAATGFYHDYSGFVVFFVGILLMLRLGTWLQRLPPHRWEAFFDTGVVPGAAGVPAPTAWRWREVALAGVLPFILAVVLVLQASLPPPVVESADFVSLELPATLAGYPGETPLFCHNEQCLHRVLRSQLDGATATPKCPRCGGELFPASLGETTKLPSDTQIAKRAYRSGDGLEIEVSLVMSGVSRMSIHRPELCLPAQGFHMSRVRRQAIPLDGRDPLEVRVVQVQKGQTRFLLIYWFVSSAHETSSHTVRILRDAWNRSVYNRINRWAMIAVTINQPVVAAETVETIRRVVADLHAALHDQKVVEHGRF